MLQVIESLHQSETAAKEEAAETLTANVAIRELTTVKKALAEAEALRQSEAATREEVTRNAVQNKAQECAMRENLAGLEAAQAHKIQVLEVQIEMLMRQLTDMDGQRQLSGMKLLTAEAQVAGTLEEQRVQEVQLKILQAQMDTLQRAGTAAIDQAVQSAAKHNAQQQAMQNELSSAAENAQKIEKALQAELNDTKLQLRQMTAEVEQMQDAAMQPDICTGLGVATPTQKRTLTENPQTGHGRPKPESHSPASSAENAGDSTTALCRKLAEALYRQERKQAIHVQELQEKLRQAQLQVMTHDKKVQRLETDDQQECEAKVALENLTQAQAADISAVEQASQSNRCRKVICKEG